MARVLSYRLHRPSGRAVVTINGRDIYLGSHGCRDSKQAIFSFREKTTTPEFLVDN